MSFLDDVHISTFFLGILFHFERNMICAMYVVLSSNDDTLVPSLVLWKVNTASLLLHQHFWGVIAQSRSLKAYLPICQFEKSRPFGAGRTQLLKRVWFKIVPLTLTLTLIIMLWYWLLLVLSKWQGYSRRMVTMRTLNARLVRTKARHSRHIRHTLGEFLAALTKHFSRATIPLVPRRSTTN